MSNLQTPFRYDFVGSFLRPEKLKKARRQFNEGKIDAAALKKVEDEAITELVSKIKELGYHVITDGEFRRATWHLDFMWGFDGIGHTPTKTGLPFHGEAAMVDDTYIVGKIGLTGEHPFVDHFRFVKALEDENTVAKQTIPSPAQFLAQFTMPFNRGCTEKHYPNEQVPYVKKMYYINTNFYRYFIGRDDQSVNETVMISRIDQQLRVTRRMVDFYTEQKISNQKCRMYMRNYLRIMMEVSSIFLILSGTPENLAKKQELWNYVKAKDKEVYKMLRYSMLGFSVNLPGKSGRWISKTGYKVMNKWIGFN